MPLVQPSTLQAVARQLDQHSVVYAQHRGKRGHPVGFAAELYSELVALSGDEGTTVTVDLTRGLSSLSRTVAVTRGTIRTGDALTARPDVNRRAATGRWRWRRRAAGWPTSGW